MIVTEIKKLSNQCCALQTFKDRCVWAYTTFTVGDCHLDDDTSDLINADIRGVVQNQIDSLTERIKKEATR